MILLLAATNEASRVASLIERAKNPREFLFDRLEDLQVVIDKLQIDIGI